MATLNSTYQYIGRSNPVSCPSGWNYYILLYAKTSGDITTGNHSVTILMRMACDAASSFYGWRTSAYAKANGATAFSWDYQQVPNASWNTSAFTEGGYTYYRWIDLREGTAVVNAGFGVAKQINIEGSWVMNETYDKGWFPYQAKYATASIPVTLPMLASASTITQASNVTLGNNCSVTWTPQAASFRYKLRFSIGNWSYTTGPIHPNKTSSYTYNLYTFPIDVANQIHTRTGTMTVTLYTYSDSGATAQIGSADTEEITVTVPETDATRPTVSMHLDPVSDLSSPFNTLYIQGKTQVMAMFLDISTKYGADWLALGFTVDGIEYGDPYISGYLSKDGVQTIKGYVKDTRGYYGYCENQITVIPYSKPKVQAVAGENNIVAIRCDKDGNINGSGTYLKIKAKIGYEKVISDGVQNNFGKIQYRYRAEGGLWPETWETILDTKTATSDEVVTGVLLNGALDVKKNYQVQVRAIDDLEESEPITLSVASEYVYMHRPARGKSMGLGGYVKGDGNLDIYWRTKARGGLSLFNEEGEEISADEMLPLPRGYLGAGWNPNDIANGVHIVDHQDYPIRDDMGNVVMSNGILIQMAANNAGSEMWKIQMAFPTDGNTPAYRIFQVDGWTPWYIWNTFMI